MFDQTFVNTHAQTNRPWTVAASLTLQTGVVALAVILPMLNPEMLRPIALPMPIYLPMRTAPQPPKVAIPVVRGTLAAPPMFKENWFAAHRTIPPHASMIADEAPGLAMASAFPGASFASIPGLSEGLPPHAIAIPETPAPVVKSVPPTGPVHVSLGVQSARLIFGPKPAYPPLAKTAHVQGTVRIAAVIAADGVIKNLQVMGGHPLLVRAALDAVQQWRYQPTLLSGKAVEVITEIDVNFTLSQ